MGSSTRIIKAALLAGAAALLAFAAFQLREKHQEAEAIVQNIHDQLDALHKFAPPPTLVEEKKVRGDQS